MKKILKNPWVLGIGTTVIGGILLSFVLDWINGVDWSSTLKTVITFISNTIIAFLTFELKVWWILIAIALIVVVLIIIAKVYDTKPKSSFLIIVFLCFLSIFFFFLICQDDELKHHILAYSIALNLNHNFYQYLS